MTADTAREMIVRASSDPVMLDLLSRNISEMYEAKQVLREKGYGWSGVSLLETAQMVEEAK